jgi:pentatricopeptide repeat protein
MVNSGHGKSKRFNKAEKWFKKIKKWFKKQKREKVQSRTWKIEKVQ